MAPQKRVDDALESGQKTVIPMEHGKAFPLFESKKVAIKRPTCWNLAKTHFGVRGVDTRKQAPHRVWEANPKRPHRARESQKNMIPTEHGDHKFDMSNTPSEGTLAQKIASSDNGVQMVFLRYQKWQYVIRC